MAVAQARALRGSICLQLTAIFAKASASHLAIFVTVLHEARLNVKRIPMPEVIINEELVAQGELYFAVHVDRPNRANPAIVGELTLDLVGPVSADVIKPRKLSGFELPALEIVHRALELAFEQGVSKILLVDPGGLLPLAKINRTAK